MSQARDNPLFSPQLSPVKRRATLPHSTDYALAVAEASMLIQHQVAQREALQLRAQQLCNQGREEQLCSQGGEGQEASATTLDTVPGNGVGSSVGKQSSSLPPQLLLPPEGPDEQEAAMRLSPRGSSSILVQLAGLPQQDDLSGVAGLEVRLVGCDDAQSPRPAVSSQAKFPAHLQYTSALSDLRDQGVASAQAHVSPLPFGTSSQGNALQPTPGWTPAKSTIPGSGSRPAPTPLPYPYRAVKGGKVTARAATLPCSPAPLPTAANSPAQCKAVKGQAARPGPRARGLSKAGNPCRLTVPSPPAASTLPTPLPLSSHCPSPAAADAASPAPAQSGWLGGSTDDSILVQLQLLEAVAGLPLAGRPWQVRQSAWDPPLPSSGTTATTPPSGPGCVEGDGVVPPVTGAAAGARDPSVGWGGEGGRVGAGAGAGESMDSRGAQGCACLLQLPEVTSAAADHACAQPLLPQSPRQDALPFSPPAITAAQFYKAGRPTPPSLSAAAAAGHTTAAPRTGDEWLGRGPGTGQEGSRSNNVAEVPGLPWGAAPSPAPTNTNVVAGGMWGAAPHSPHGSTDRQHTPPQQHRPLAADTQAGWDPSLPCPATAQPVPDASSPATAQPWPHLAATPATTKPTSAHLASHPLLDCGTTHHRRTTGFSGPQAEPSLAFSASTLGSPPSPAHPPRPSSPTHSPLARGWDAASTHPAPGPYPAPSFVPAAISEPYPCWGSCEGGFDGTAQPPPAPYLAAPHSLPTAAGTLTGALQQQPGVQSLPHQQQQPVWLHPGNTAASQQCAEVPGRSSSRPAAELPGWPVGAVGPAAAGTGAGWQGAATGEGQLADWPGWLSPPLAPPLPGPRPSLLPSHRISCDSFASLTASISLSLDARHGELGSEGPAARLQAARQGQAGMDVSSWLLSRSAAALAPGLSHAAARTHPSSGPALLTASGEGAGTAAGPGPGVPHPQQSAVAGPPLRQRVPVQQLLQQQQGASPAKRELWLKTTATTTGPGVARVAAKASSWTPRKAPAPVARRMAVGASPLRNPPLQPPLQAPYQPVTCTQGLPAMQSSLVAKGTVDPPLQSSRSARAATPPRLLSSHPPSPAPASRQVWPGARGRRAPLPPTSPTPSSHHPRSSSSPTPLWQLPAWQQRMSSPPTQTRAHPGTRAWSPPLPPRPTRPSSQSPPMRQQGRRAAAAAQSQPAPATLAALPKPKRPAWQSSVTLRPSRQRSPNPLQQDPGHAASAQLPGPHPSSRFPSAPRQARARSLSPFGQQGMGRQAAPSPLTAWQAARDPLMTPLTQSQAWCPAKPQVIPPAQSHPPAASPPPHLQQHSHQGRLQLTYTARAAAKAVSSPGTTPAVAALRPAACHRYSLQGPVADGQGEVATLQGVAILLLPGLQPQHPFRAGSPPLPQPGRSGHRVEEHAGPCQAGRTGLSHLLPLPTGPAALPQLSQQQLEAMLAVVRQAAALRARQGSGVMPPPPCPAAPAGPSISHDTLTPASAAAPVMAGPLPSAWPSPPPVPSSAAPAATTPGTLLQAVTAAPAALVAPGLAPAADRAAGIPANSPDIPMIPAAAAMSPGASHLPLPPPSSLPDSVPGIPPMILPFADVETAAARPSSAVAALRGEYTYPTDPAPDGAISQAAMPTVDSATPPAPQGPVHPADSLTSWAVDSTLSPQLLVQAEEPAPSPPPTPPPLPLPPALPPATMPTLHPQPSQVPPWTLPTPPPTPLLLHLTAGVHTARAPAEGLAPSDSAPPLPLPPAPATAAGALLERPPALSHALPPQLPHIPDPRPASTPAGRASTGLPPGPPSSQLLVYPAHPPPPRPTVPYPARSLSPDISAARHTRPGPPAPHPTPHPAASPPPPPAQLLPAPHPPRCHRPSSINTSRPLPYPLSLGVPTNTLPAVHPGHSPQLSAGSWGAAAPAAVRGSWQQEGAWVAGLSASTQALHRLALLRASTQSSNSPDRAGLFDRAAALRASSVSRGSLRDRLPPSARVAPFPMLDNSHAADLGLEAAPSIQACDDTALWTTTLSRMPTMELPSPAASDAADLGPGPDCGQHSSTLPPLPAQQVAEPQVEQVEVQQEQEQQQRQRKQKQQWQAEEEQQRQKEQEQQRLQQHSRPRDGKPGSALYLPYPSPALPTPALLHCVTRPNESMTGAVAAHPSSHAVSHGPAPCPTPVEQQPSESRDERIAAHSCAPPAASRPGLPPSTHSHQSAAGIPPLPCATSPWRHTSAVHTIRGASMGREVGEGEGEEEEEEEKEEGEEEGEGDEEDGGLGMTDEEWLDQLTAGLVDDGGEGAGGLFLEEEEEEEEVGSRQQQVLADPRTALQREGSSATHQATLSASLTLHCSDASEPPPPAPAPTPAPTPAPAPPPASDDVGAAPEYGLSARAVTSSPRPAARQAVPHTQLPSTSQLQKPPQPVQRRLTWSGPASLPALLPPPLPPSLPALLPPVASHPCPHELCNNVPHSKNRTSPLASASVAALAARTAAGAAGPPGRPASVAAAAAAAAVARRAADAPPAPAHPAVIQPDRPAPAPQAVGQSSAVLLQPLSPATTYPCLPLPGPRHTSLPTSPLTSPSRACAPEATATRPPLLLPATCGGRPRYPCDAPPLSPAPLPMLLLPLTQADQGQERPMSSSPPVPSPPADNHQSQMDPQHLHLPLPPHSTFATPQALALSPDHLAHQHPAHAGHCSHTYGHARLPGVTHQCTLTTHHHSNPDRDVSPRRQSCDGQEGRYTQSWASSPPQQLSTGGLATSGRSSRSSSRSGHSSSSSSSGCDSWGGSKGVLGMRHKAGAGCWDEGGENGEGEGSGAGPGVHMEGSPCSHLARSGTSDSTGIGSGPHSRSGRAGLVCVPAHQPSAPGECEVSGGGSEGVAAEGGGGGKERQEQHSGGPAEGSSGGGGGWGWEEQQGCASPTTSAPVQQPGRHTQGTRRRSASSASLLSLVGPGAAPRVGRCLTQQAACTSAPNAPTSLLPGLSPRRCHSPRSLPSPVARIGSEPLLPPRPRPPRPALPARGQLSCPEPPALQPAQLAAEQSPSALLPAPDVPLVPAAMAGPPAVAPTAAAPAPPPAALAALSTLPTAQQPTQDLEPEPQAALAPPVVPSQPPHQLDSPHGGIRLSPSPRLIPSPTPSPRLGSGRAPSPHASPSPSPYRGLSPSPCQRSSPSPGPSPRSAPGSPLMQRLGTLLMQGVAITAAGVLGAGLSQVARGDASPPKRSRHRTGTPPPASPRVAACPLSTPTSPAQHLGAGPARLLPGCPQPGPGMCQVDMEIRSWRGRERGRGATPRRSMRPDESELRLSPKELREERARSRITSRPDGVW